jgi:predicted secreted protein
VLTGLEESGAYNDAMTFSASLQSSGAWTYTAGA